MKRSLISLISLSSYPATLLLAADPATPGPGLHVIKTYAVGGEGWWDYSRWTPIRAASTSPVELMSW